jgi:hypothetical protein
MSLVLPEFENGEDISHALSTSKADLLLVSPYSNLTSTTKRIDYLNSIMPELKEFRYGDNFNNNAFPNLKLIMQISHVTIPGTQKFKHNLNYTKPILTHLKLPNLNPNDIVLEIHGKN